MKIDQINNITKLYQSISAAGVAGQQAQALLAQMHWFTVNADFDPKTGDVLPQTLSTFLAKVARPATAGTYDRLWRITEHAFPSLIRLFRALNKSPRREQALLPVRAVRELDANSFIKLSNRPGRTIREKLASKPYLQAVRRFQSVDLPENRLLKAFVTRLAELLELRQNCFGEEEHDLLPKIQSWLLSDEAQTITRWDNLPPNNTLLSHRDYRRVWDAWRWLQRLDEDIATDFSQLEARNDTMCLWDEYGQMYLDGTHSFAEMPIFFDYEKYEIRPWFSHLAFKKVTEKITRSFGTNKSCESGPVCVDLAGFLPSYAITTKSSSTLPETYLWQQWEKDDQSVAIELFNSDAIYLHSDATTISLADLFFSKNKPRDYLDRAARAFVSRLRENFRNDTLVWLAPDFLNDFELGILRRNINVRFPYAEPLPRSVAAVLGQIDYSKIKNDGYSVVVVDAIGGETCVTKLIARLDPELKKCIPNTKGFFWERYPPIIISRQNSEKKKGIEKSPLNMISLYQNGQWHDAVQTEKPNLVAPNTLKSHIGQFDLFINLTDSPVVGGITLQSLQQRAGEIPLWRDNIPELSIKVMQDGLYQRFYLVSRGTPVRPIRGFTVSIPVDKNFTLPANKPRYQFPLYQGASADELGFEARLDSPAFPLKTDIECKLNLTFAYGTDEPYELIFTPLDDSFDPIRATWQRSEEKVITDAPAPRYPRSESWENILDFPDEKNGGTINLIQEGIVSTAENLNKWLSWGNDNGWEKIEKNIKGWCRFVFLSVWREGRSISDSGCPTECNDAVRNLLHTLHNIYKRSTEEGRGVSQFDLMLLLSAMHKDMPDDCIGMLQKLAEEQHDKNARLIGYALGDMSTSWQQSLLSYLLMEPQDFTLNVLSYAIWRERYFFENFSLVDLQKVLDALSMRLAKVKQLESRFHRISSEKWKWAKATAELLELLLGLLRTRASTNQKIKMLLQPHQKITTELANHIERVTEIIVKSNVNLSSRVQLDIQKPAGDRTPDLLYALRLYLTGDDGANAIHITSVSDNDND